MIFQTHEPLYDKYQIARSFSKAAPTYETQALLQKYTGNHLLKKMQQTVGQPHCILDAGAGTGYFTQKLGTLHPSQ